jgi:putative colanic acid biosynthesis acetyltransferase WcaF
MDGQDMTPIYQDLSQSRAPKQFRGRSGLVVLIWQLVQRTLFLWSPQPAYFWRVWLLRLFGAKVGKGVLVRPTARVTYPWKVSLGDHCWVGDDAEIYSLGPISVGSNAIVGQRSYVCAATHDYADITFPLVAKAVIIEPEVWIATDCYIAPGVTIGRGTIVGARSTVLTNIAPGLIVAGTPARVIKTRPPSRLNGAEANSVQTP